MKYFLLKGIKPSISRSGIYARTGSIRKKDYEVERVKYDYLPPGETAIYHDKTYGSISIFVYELVQTFFLVKAASQRKAYALANSFRSILGIYYGRSWDYHGEESLVELLCAPRSDMSIQGLLEITRVVSPYFIDKDMQKYRMTEGVFVFHSEIEHAGSILRHVIREPRFVHALQHLSQSHSIISGEMTGSYYFSHYRHKRKSESKYYREKMYLEFRTQYDLAFLSAFRALEAVLGRFSFDKHEINKLLGKLDACYKTNFRESVWQSYHEIFAGAKRKRPYQEVIENFLRIRNSVAAHGNTHPPFILTEDHVFEIQRLVSSMLSDTMKLESEINS